MVHSCSVGTTQTNAPTPPHPCTPIPEMHNILNDYHGSQRRHRRRASICRRLFTEKCDSKAHARSQGELHCWRALCLQWRASRQDLTLMFHCVCARMRVCTYACVSVCVYACACVRMCKRVLSVGTRVSTNTHSPGIYRVSRQSHAYAHTHTHTHTQTCAGTCAGL